MVDLDHSAASGLEGQGFLEVLVVEVDPLALISTLGDCVELAGLVVAR